VRRFPAGRYGRQRLEFFPAPFRAPLRAFAALVFPWRGEEVLLCDIARRGWCIPSGRVEPFESSDEAARREALEEAGIELLDLQYIGCYRIQERQEVRWADCYSASIGRLLDMPLSDESLGRRLFVRHELPEHYHEWNPLTEQVFDHSLEVLIRLQQRRGDPPPT
jgi:8-oxo-dGTP diphosphatase